MSFNETVYGVIPSKLNDAINLLPYLIGESSPSTVGLLGTPKALWPRIMAYGQLGHSSSLLRAAAIIAFVWLPTCAAHDHHADEIPEGEAISPEPIVSLLLGFPRGFRC